MNARWHRDHPMPKRPTPERRLQWYLEHDVSCACRRIPEWAREELERWLASRKTLTPRA